MTDAERTRLRRLQDRWLNHPDTIAAIAARERDGLTIEDVEIDGPGSPTLFQVKFFVLPAWEYVFRRRVS